MITVIGKNKSIKANKYILENRQIDVQDITRVYSLSNVVVIDLNKISQLCDEALRIILEANSSYFTADCFALIEEYMDNNYISRKSFKVIGGYNSTKYKVEEINLNDIYNIKTNKVSVIDETKFGINEVITNRKMLMKAAYSNFILETKNTTLGSYWHIVRDIIFFVTYITFMTFLRGNGAIEGIPAILYLVIGLVPWYFMSDVLNGGVNCIKNYRHVISKVKFPVTIIPFYNTLSAFYKRGLTYLILAVVVLVYFIKGDIDGFRFIVFIYFNVSMILFMMAYNLVFSSLISVSNDFNELYKSIQRVQFYFLPIFWDFTMIGQKLVSSDPLTNLFGKIIYYILYLNPISYILNGFRLSVGATDHITLMYSLYFWVVTIIMFVIGFSLQYRLKKIYADVL